MYFTEMNVIEARFSYCLCLKRNNSERALNPLVYVFVFSCVTNFGVRSCRMTWKCCLQLHVETNESWTFPGIFYVQGDSHHPCLGQLFAWLLLKGILPVPPLGRFTH